MKMYVVISQGMLIKKSLNKQEIEFEVNKDNEEFYKYKQACLDEHEEYADNEMKIEEEEIKSIVYTCKSVPKVYLGNCFEEATLDFSSNIGESVDKYDLIIIEENQELINSLLKDKVDCKTTIGILKDIDNIKSKDELFENLTLL